MMFGYGWALTPWGWALVCLMAGFCVIVVGGVYWLTRVFGRTGRSESAPTASTPPDKPSAQQILGERFARGEIDDHEYEDRLATLQGSSHR